MLLLALLLGAAPFFFVDFLDRAMPLSHCRGRCVLVPPLRVHRHHRVSIPPRYLFAPEAYFELATSCSPCVWAISSPYDGRCATAIPAFFSCVLLSAVSASRNMPIQPALLATCNIFLGPRLAVQRVKGAAAKRLGPVDFRVQQCWVRPVGAELRLKVELEWVLVREDVGAKIDGVKVRVRERS